MTSPEILPAVAWPAVVGVLEHDSLLADLDATRRSIGEKHDLHGYLIGEPQQIGGITPGRLQKDLVPPLERFDSGHYGRGKEAELRIDARVVVKPAGQAAQRPFSLPAGAAPGPRPGGSRGPKSRLG